MLSLKSQEKLANLLSTMSEGESKLELLKSQLCKMPTFEPQTTFARLDRQQNGYLTINDFNSFFLTHQIEQNNTELTLLFAKFRPAQPQQIVCEEFVATIIPCFQQQQSNTKINFLQVQQRKTRTVRPNQFLDLKLEQSLLQLFQQLIRNGRSYELYRDTLLQAFDFSQAGCFCSLTDDPYIERQNLATFMKKHFRFQSAEELDALTNYLDYDCDGQISFEDFVNSTIKSGLQTTNIGQCKYQRQEEIDSFSPSRVLTNASPTRYSAASPSKQTFTNVSGKQLLVLQNTENCNQIVKDNLKYSNYIQSVKGKSEISNWNEIKIELHSPGFIKHKSNKIIELLKNMIIMERELSKLKLNLSQMPDFNLLDCYSLFDTSHNQKISSQELSQGLQNLGIQANAEQLYLFFLYYDKSNNGYLQYGDFCQIFSPGQFSQTATPSFLQFNPPTLALLRTLFEQIFATEEQIDEFRQELVVHPEFNLSHAFSGLDLGKDGRIQLEELKGSLEREGMAVGEQEIISVFQRFDKDRDGEIRFMEFVREMEPKSPVKRRKVNKF